MLVIDHSQIIVCFLLHTHTRGQIIKNECIKHYQFWLVQRGVIDSVWHQTKYQLLKKSHKVTETPSHLESNLCREFSTSTPNQKNNVSQSFFLANEKNEESTELRQSVSFDNKSTPSSLITFYSSAKIIIKCVPILIRKPINSIQRKNEYITNQNLFLLYSHIPYIYHNIWEKNYNTE